MRRESQSGSRARLLRRMAEAMRRAPSLLEEYVAKIASAEPEATVLLFGSRSRGEGEPYSDYDVAVVLRGAVDKLEAVLRLRRLKPRALSLDLVVLLPEDLEDPLIRNMLKGAVVLHDGGALPRSLAENLNPRFQERDASLSSRPSS